MASAGLEVKEAGRALRVQTEAPHLVSMGSGRLSTAVTLHPLPEGRVILGADRNADIPVSGTGVEAVHCAIENNNGVVTLHPINGSTSIDGTVTSTSVRLAQGCMISIGRSNYMRFNHPTEAKHLKSVLPNPRISMAPISFSLLQDNADLERKPPLAPRKSPRNSCSDDEIGFLGKLTKFEMLARQSRNCVSPKVFPAGSLTTNVPADQILGHSRSSSLVSLGKSHNSPLQNLTNFDRSRSNTPNHVVGSPIGGYSHGEEQRMKIDSRTPSRSNTPNFGYHTSTPNNNQLQMYSSTEAFLKSTCTRPQYIENDENNGIYGKSNSSNIDLMSRSLTCHRSSEFDKFGREYDMSQSLIVAKTTTTEYLQVEQFGSNPNLHNRPGMSHSNGGANNSGVNQCFGSNSNIKRIQPPSPAFNRNPKYSEPKKFYGGRVKSPTPSIGSNCSLEELRERQIDAENKRKEAEFRRKLAQEERVKEQEIEKLEKMRLEEILAMCAEYERQSAVDKPRQPNRIKTNGSLPRDKRPGYNSPYSPKSPSTSQPQFSFDSPNAQPQNSRKSHKNGGIPNNTRALLDQPPSPNNNRSRKWQSSPTNCNNHGFSTSISQARGTNYENARIKQCETDKCNELTNQSTFSTIQLNGTRIASNTVPNYENIVVNGNNSIYENVVSSSSSSASSSSTQNNNNNQSNSLKRNGNLTNTCEVIENKLAISNDDLLEAIEQLSMLSKSKDNCVTPKKNNVEKDNTKSNEAKADKERKVLEEEDKRKYIEFLQNEKLHILGNMDMLKRSIADIEIQEEEISRELELEKALLSAEYESESLKLTTDESEKINLQMRINELEREMADDNAAQANLQSEAKMRVDKAQNLCLHFEDELKNCQDDDQQHEIIDKLNAQQETLETERKTFEDLEFHHLEEEASKLATREELQRYLSELSNKIEARKAQLSHLESQRNEAKTTATKESRSLERQKLGHMRRLEEGRNRIRAIDDELEKLTSNPSENFDDKRSPSREDFDRISRVTTDSPIVNNQGSLGRKTIESLKEIERNRQLHLAKQGSQVISEERRRVEELKRRVQDEVRSQWEERKLNCASFNSVESGEESSSYSTGPTESGSGSSDGADTGASEKMSPSKLSEFTSPSPGPSTNSYMLLQNENMRDGRRTSMEAERLSSNSVGLVDDNGSRPLSQTSSEMDSVGSLQAVKYRDKQKLQRPLTRYLPIKSESLDLRHHIETAGHQLPLIHDVTVDTTTCSGYLSKMSKKFHHWNKRWFVFDRKRKTLSYFTDNNSKKARGLIYFQSIEEVYVDHMNTVRSPQPSLTFIIKTSTRLYHLMAPSPEAMRVWVDVVFTGAEGYHEFDHGV